MHQCATPPPLFNLLSVHQMCTTDYYRKILCIRLCTNKGCCAPDMSGAHHVHSILGYTKSLIICRHRILLIAYLNINVIIVTVLGLGPWYCFILSKLFILEIYCVLAIIFNIFRLDRWDLF
jgi:hypothetical protein